MHERCNDKKHPHYYRYGGVGITVCQEWFNFNKFLEDLGERPEGTSLDRIDNSKGYSPDNCKWSSKIEQEFNKKKKSVTGFKHVSKAKGRYRAVFNASGVKVHVGYFNTELEAAVEVDIHYHEWYGISGIAGLNFPELIKV